MAFLVKLGASDGQTFMNCDVRRFELSWVIQHTTADTNFTGVINNFLQQTVKVVLRRGGNEYTLVSCPVYIWLAYSNWLKNNFLNLFNTGTTFYTQLQAQGGGAKLIVGLGGEFILPSFVNLRGSDELRIDLNVTTGYNSSADTSASNVYITRINETGTEWVTPYLKSQVITSGATSANVMCGDNVTDILLLNSDQTTDQFGTRVFDTFSMSSHNGSLNLSWYELMMERQSQFYNNNTATTNATGRLQSFMPLIASSPQHKCVVDLNLVGANVAASKNYVVWATFYTDERIQMLARQNQG